MLNQLRCYNGVHKIFVTITTETFQLKQSQLHQRSTENILYKPLSSAFDNS